MSSVVDTLAVRSIPDLVPAPNRTLAWPAVEWATEYLLQPDGPGAGEPWEFTAEQVRMLARWYAVDARGRFLYRRGVFRRMKGAGKSPIAAVLAAIELCGPCRFDGFDAEGMPVAVQHPAPAIAIAGVSLEQSRNVFGLFAGLFSDAAVDEYGLDIGRTLIYARGSCRIEGVTSSPRALEGRRPSFCIMDETSHWISSNDGHEMAAVIARNQAKSNQGSSRALELANAHLPGEDSVAERTFEAWRKANGRVPGLLYDSLEAAPIEDLADEEAVRAGLLAARGDATWLDVDRLLAEIQDPATAEHISRRFYLNQVVRVEGERWMRMDVWDACARPDYVIPERAEVVLGFDGSRTGDSTALVAVSVVTAEEVPHLEVVRLFENTSDDPGWEVDMEAVMDDVRAACRRWRVREIAADLTYWQLPMRILESERLPVVEMPQSLQRMGPATTAFQQAVYNGRLTQSGDPDLRRHVSNAVLVVSSRGDKLAKDSQHSPRRIDLAVAAVMALSRAGSAKKRHVGMFMTQPDGSQVDVVARAREQAATREHERQAEPEPQPPRGSVFA